MAICLFGLYFALIDHATILPQWVQHAFGGDELRYVLFGAYLSAIVVAVRIFDAFIFDFVFSRRRHIVAPLLLREILSIAFYLIGIAWAISSVFKYSITAITGLLTTTTVVAAVIGLALQDTLGNLFAGISLHMERTFDVGDVIQLGDHIGVVESVNWRATRIRTFNNNLVILPNSAIARERIEVFPKDNFNARVLSVGVSYEEPPADVIRVLGQAVSNAEGIVKEFTPIIRVADFGDSAVLYEIKYWTRDYHLRETIDAEVRKNVWYALRRHNMSIPWPIRSVHLLEQKPQRPAVSSALTLQRLQEVDVLQPLSEQEHQAIAAGTTVLVFSKGETIIRHGDPGNSMFVVHEGEVSIRVPDGTQLKEVARIGPGGVFGEMALLTGESRTADVVALTDCQILEIDKDDLQPILVDNPILATSISEKMTRRRDRLAEARAQWTDESASLLRKIRSYFSLK